MILLQLIPLRWHGDPERHGEYWDGQQGQARRGHPARKVGKGARPSALFVCHNQQCFRSVLNGLLDPYPYLEQLQKSIGQSDDIGTYAVKMASLDIKLRYCSFNSTIFNNSAVVIKNSIISGRLKKRLVPNPDCIQILVLSETLIICSLCAKIIYCFPV